MAETITIKLEEDSQQPQPGAAPQAPSNVPQAVAQAASVGPVAQAATLAAQAATPLVAQIATQAAKQAVSAPMSAASAAEAMRQGERPIVVNMAQQAAAAASAPAGKQAAASATSATNPPTVNPATWADRLQARAQAFQSGIGSQLGNTAKILAATGNATGAQVAGGASSALGALAAGAGPVGAAVSAVPMVLSILQQREQEKKEREIRQIQTVTEHLGMMGASLAQLARGDNSGAIFSATEQLRSLAQTTGLVSEKNAELLKIPLLGAESLRRLVGSLNLRANQLADYSGPLSAAMAAREVAEIQRDMREAQRFGPGLARLTDAQTSLDQSISRALEPLKERLINLTTVIVERLDKGVQNLEGWKEYAENQSRKMLEEISNHPLIGAYLKRVAPETMRAVKGLLEAATKEKHDERTAFDNFMAMIRQAGVGMDQGDHLGIGIGSDERLRAPIL